MTPLDEWEIHVLGCSRCVPVMLGEPLEPEKLCQEGRQLFWQWIQAEVNA